MESRLKLRLQSLKIIKFIVVVNPTMELTGALISRLIEKKSESSPWELTLPANRIRWQEKVEIKIT